MKGDDVYLDPDVARDEFKRRSQFNVIDTATFWKADLIFRKTRPFSRSEMDRRVPTQVLGVDAFVASAEACRRRSPGRGDRTQGSTP